MGFEYFFVGADRDAVSGVGRLFLEFSGGGGTGVGTLFFEFWGAGMVRVGVLGGAGMVRVGVGALGWCG